MKTQITLSLAAAVIIVGCADINFEVQQTQRVNSSASKNPRFSDSDVLGSERVQSKAETGIDSKTEIGGDDITGAEK